MWTALNWHQHSLSNTYAHQKGWSLSYLIYSSIQCYILSHHTLSQYKWVKFKEQWDMWIILLWFKKYNKLTSHSQCRSVHCTDAADPFYFKRKLVTTDCKNKLKLCIYTHSRGSLIKLIFCKWQANTILWKTDYHKNSWRKPDSNQACVSRELSFAQEMGWSAVMEEYPTRINCS